VSLRVCLSARMLRYLQGGGLVWLYLNWALGRRALGCQVIWLERVVPSHPAHEAQASIAALKSHVELNVERFDTASDGRLDGS
jgi:hypothetical protein